MSEPTRPAQSQITTPNLHVEATDGVTYRYRRFGTPNASNLPLVCLMQVRASLDNWDPKLVDALAAEREVILVDLAGVGGSTGTTPNTVEEMAYNAFSFLDAIGLYRYDLLGFSIGGFIAQEAALLRPWQVRRLVLAGTAPRGGRDIHLYTAGPIRDAAFDDTPAPASLLTLFFEKSASSQAGGVEFLKRLGARTAERDAPGNPRRPRRPAHRDLRVGRARGHPPAASGLDPAARSGGQRRQRRDGPHPEHLPIGRASAQRQAEHLPGRRSRVPLPVRRAVRSRGERIPRQLREDRGR